MFAISFFEASEFESKMTSEMRNLMSSSLHTVAQSKKKAYINVTSMTHA